MRISDGSSDVCSSDLFAEGVAAGQQVVHGGVAQFVQAMHVEVLAAGDQRQFAMRGRYLHPFAKRAQRGEAALPVLDVAGQFVGGGQRSGERRDGKRWVSTCSVRWVRVQ